MSASPCHHSAAVGPTRQAVSVTAQGEKEAGEQGPVLSPTRRPHLLNKAGPKRVLDKAGGDAAVSSELSDITGPERREAKRH